MIEEEQKKDIEQQIMLANEHRTDLTTFKIEDAHDAQLAGQVIKDVSDKVREIEKRRKRVTEPMLRAKKEADALFKEWTKPLEDINKHLRAELVAYDARQEEARKAAEMEARKAAALDEDPEKVRNLLVKSSQKTETPKGVTFTKKWVATVVDFAKLPDEYKKVDDVKLRALAKKSQGNDEVPGVIFTLEKSVRA